MKTIYAALLAAVSVAGFAGTADAQTKYFAREMLTTGPSGTGSSGNDSNTTPPKLTVTCGLTKTHQVWSYEPDSKAVVLGNDAQDSTGKTAQKLCQDYATRSGKPGVCAVNYTVYYFPGDTRLMPLSSVFQPDYAFSCPGK